MTIYLLIPQCGLKSLVGVLGFSLPLGEMSEGQRRGFLLGTIIARHF